MTNCLLCGIQLDAVDEISVCGSCSIAIHNSLYHALSSINIIQKRIENVIRICCFRRTSEYKIKPQLFYYYNYDKNQKPIEMDNDGYECVNIADELRSYPHTFTQRIEEGLYNLSIKYSEAGKVFPINLLDAWMLYCESKNARNEMYYFLQMARALGFLSYEQDTLDERIFRCQITLDGWKKIDEFSSKHQEINQAFIAMKFGTSTESIANAFKRAISECGYKPYKMDEYEHNNQIVPEMFFEITRSRFMVVDVSVSNFGAYYEAGYAQALGKQVIVCCKKENEKQIHFDISQQNIVLWDDEEDLIAKLKRRIEATVGMV